MKLYLDSSAIVKLVKQERESAALRQFLRDHSEDTPATSALARVEVIRAVIGGGPAAWPTPGASWTGSTRWLWTVICSTRPLPCLRRHLCALRTQFTLPPPACWVTSCGAVVTYDQRMGEAAEALAMVVALPA